MHVVVVHGSPKGERSVTLQSIRWLQARHPEHTFEVLPIGARIAGIERNKARMDEVLATLGRADLILWATPVYYLLVPSPLKRFIELLHARGGGVVAGKYAAALTTSIHFYDHTAQDYLRAVSEDLGMRFLGGYSAGMRDLLDATEQQRLDRWARDRFDEVARGAPCQRRFAPVVASDGAYAPSPVAEPRGAEGLRVLLITDARPEDRGQLGLTARFVDHLGGQVRVVNLRDVDTKGGCLGCCKCGLDNVCSYDGKDDFVEFYRSQVMTADVVVFCGHVEDRYLSSVWKRFFDRSFVQGHAPSLLGRQLIFLISGPVSQLATLREVLEGWAEIQHANVAAWVSDEGAAESIDACVDAAADTAVDAARSGFVRAPTFRGVAGMKLFRDELWGPLRPVFQADHVAYRRLGFYDFPQRRWGERLLTRVAYWALQIPFLRRQFRAKMVEGMVYPARRVADTAIAAR